MKDGNEIKVKRRGKWRRREQDKRGRKKEGGEGKGLRKEGRAEGKGEENGEGEGTEE